MTEKQVNYETGEVQPIAPTPIDPKAQATLFAKLARAMGSLSRLPKSGHNDHFNYDYVTDGDVSEAVRKALADETVAFFASMRGIQFEGKKTTVHFTYTFADGETGVTWSCDWAGEAIDSQDKAIAKATTTSLKTFLLKNFIVSTGDPSDDPDADGPEPQPKQAKKSAPPTPKANGNGSNDKKATVGTGLWADAAKALAERVPYYMAANGPNYHHMLGAAAKLGFDGVNDDNLANVIKELEAHASQAANQEADA